MHSANDYYSAIQLRADSWSALRDATGALVEETSEKRRSSLRNRASDLFKSLAMMERYWAFPGLAAFDHIQRQFDHGNFDDVAFSVRRVTRALTTGAYRRRHIPLERDSMDSEEQEDEAHLSPEARALSKPYFEVLIVDNVNEDQERWLRSNMARMRRPEDPFAYQALVVPSLEDALIAVLFNYNIQAIVVRPGLTLKSKMDQPILTRYLARSGGTEQFDEMAPRRLWPGIVSSGCQNPA